MAGAARGAGNAHSFGAPDFTLDFPGVRDIRFTIDFTTDVYFVHGLRLLITGLFDGISPFSFRVSSLLVNIFHQNVNTPKIILFVTYMYNHTTCIISIIANHVPL